MKINLKKLHKYERQVEIDGSESWLGRLYSYYPFTQEKKAQLTASLTLKNDAVAGVLTIEGDLCFVHQAHCKRCWQVLSPAPYMTKINLLYDQSSEVLEDLNEDYRYEEKEFLDGDTIDLESFFYDTILLARPSDLSPGVSLAGQTVSCLSCSSGKLKKEVYSSDKNKEFSSHPAFQKLKDFF